MCGLRGALLADSALPDRVAAPLRSVSEPGCVLGAAHEAGVCSLVSSAGPMQRDLLLPRCADVQAEAWGLHQGHSWDWTGALPWLCGLRPGCSTCGILPSLF